MINHWIFKSICWKRVLAYNMSVYEDINENLSAQVYELEALQSVYPRELIIADHGVLADINNFIKSPTEEIPQRLEYSIKISINNDTIELLISLPTDYPKEKPEIYARSSSLNRSQQFFMNNALSTVVQSQEEGEPCIYALISWLQDNAEHYLMASKSTEEKEHNVMRNKEEKDESMVFARYWIYSHHIYSKFKRRDIIALARENSITGFCLAGKPGVICMEGTFEDCDYCWQKIKAMNWQKILIRFLEKENDCTDVSTMRRFSDFQEISFPTAERHNDMGLLLKYLTEHNLQFAFKEVFGIKGKYNELPD